jgi:asparagine synthase (glutamine-hydrolysing)
MCGIVGVVNLSGAPVSANLLKRMTDRIAHRGPDGEGHYTDGPVGLGHRRLAIIDLSPAGHQPMANETGDVVITYNGEVYNFQKLRVELEALGHHFHSQTDTEVAVHGYEEWGPACLERLNGMFAFGIWDRRRHRVWLARDRYGIKPLYWTCQDGFFVFASEIKAILDHPRVRRRLCYPALNEYFTFQNVLSDLTLFEGIHLLPAGSHLTLEVQPDGRPVVQRYWDFANEPEGLEPTEEEATAGVRQRAFAAVTRQLISDVPVGAYLSGGVDSGTITAVAARELPRLTTFTGGFDLSSASGLELAFDERERAEMLANLLKTEHYEVVLHAGDMEWVLPQLIWHLEDLRVGQCYPNYYVARLASKFVKVVLSGTGGDELFGGYPWRYYRGLNSTSPQDYYRRYYQFWQRLVDDEHKRLLFNRATLRELNGHSTYEVFRRVFDGWNWPLHTNADFVNASLYFEQKTFLHGLLVVDDKLSMAHGLETRVPFLDDQLVDYAVGLPVRYKLRDLDHWDRVDENEIARRHQQVARTNDGKMILRKAVQSLLPPQAADRTKQGFSAPDASWFRGESIDYINKLLANPKAKLYEFLEPDFVSRVLHEHSVGRVNRRLLIWSLLSFEWWCRVFFE